MSDNIKVVVKVRPLISREIEGKLSYQWRVKNNTLYQLDENGRELGSSYTFDKVYGEETKTSDVFEDVAKPIVEAATAGFNGTIFAYGQTSSGKTYTMAGTEDSPGIIPLAVYNLFEIIKGIPDRDFLVRVSYIEIYNEALKDLLHVEKKNIKVHETLQGVKVDVTEHVTTSPEEVLKYLKQGEANRQTGATNMNEISSRSHSIFQITIESREHVEGEVEAAGCVNVSTLNLVDLAGSERAGQTGATGIRFKEGTHINKSLSALALVIKQLSEDPNKFANYRDSKLTRILQNSLGGNAKTSIICAITPAAIEETISTLQFANRAKAIKNKPEVNAVATDATMIQSLTKQLSKLQSQLESKRNLEVMLESKKNAEVNLQKQIAALQKLILNGFGQRSSAEIVGPRRKNAQLRRVTISTLHSIEEDPTPAIPKFCTPSLKYNSMLMPGAPDFVPIQDESRLFSVPEETRLVTPPPSEKRVNFQDDVINLDSDDDSEDITCSPYHECYAASKTPPCVLRRKAKNAEQDLKEIVELTEREKIYTPSVVELMEKLEQNTSVIAKLEEQVSSLDKISKEKDLEIDKLKLKISESEEEIKSVASAKLDLDALCKEYATKLTDREVCYETLIQKSKRREEELLSLLEEQQKMHKRPEDISGKTLSRTIDRELSQFMDMSKDISLVNSDNESSIANTNDDESSSQIQNLVAEMQTQLTAKTQAMLELESNLFAHNQKIESLELSCKELQVMLNNFKDKLSRSENENHLLKSTVETLNTTIHNQKSNLESAHADINSYNSLIQELHIKLRQKESIADVNINESILEKMIQNEEKFIANNENMKNIIHSFKIAIDSRNKEIESLKLIKLDKCDDNDLRKELDAKEKQINGLCEEAQKLKDQIAENIALIDKLQSEKKVLLESEYQLSEKLLALEEKNNKIEQINDENSNLLLTLQATNYQLTQTVSDQNEKEQELASINENLNSQKEELEQLIGKLESDIKDKNSLIESLKKEDTELQQNLSTAMSAITRLQSIVGSLTGDIQEVPQMIDNFVVIFNILNSNLNVLETTVADIINQKEAKIAVGNQLREELSILKQKHDQETKELLSQIETLNSRENNIALQNENLKKELALISIDLDASRDALENLNKKCNDLDKKLHEINEENKNLRESNSLKDEELISMRETLGCLNEEVSKFQLEYEAKYKDYMDHINKTVLEKENKIVDLESKLKDIENNLVGKSAELAKYTQELNEATEKRDQMMLDVLQKALDLTNAYNITTDVSVLKEDHSDTYNQILSALERISCHFAAMNSEAAVEHDNANKYLSESKQEIMSLTHQNGLLTENVSAMEIKNEQLMAELEVIRAKYNNLQRDLMQGNQLIESLQNELKGKLIEIETNESKVLELKEKVGFLDLSTNQKIQELQLENEQLLLKCQSLEAISCRQNKIYNSDYEDVDSNNGSNAVKKTVNNVVEQNECKPPSLVTICCKRIEECIQPTENKVTSSKSDASIGSVDKATQTIKCHCERLISELAATKQHNKELSSIIERLLVEQKEVRKEVELLLEPANELQKKIVNHRTNLSTLTATTYAENKSLKSQVTALQHHHTRFHMLCQRDIPAVKRQLFELMTILKKDSSFMDKANMSFKRFSLPDTLENNSTISSFKNDETTLDGDLLMLDTNVTLATSADNTLMGHDQTCLDISQAFMYSEVACQTNNATEAPELFAINSQMEILSTDNLKMNEKLESLKEENIKLREQIDKYTKLKESKLDAQTSPNKINTTIEATNIIDCLKCETLKNAQRGFIEKQEKLNEELRKLNQGIVDLKSEKDTIEEKYKNLMLEIPSTEALVRKLNILETEKNNEIGKLMHAINSKNEEIKRLQEENDTLSTQVMENIDEADDLNKQVQTLTDTNSELMKKCSELQDVIEQNYNVKTNGRCQHCETKNDLTNSLVIDNVNQQHSKLNRSFSESDTSSRLNKICTLQNQLHASKQDCKELTEDVTTIKIHLERSNLSMGNNMDLDDSMGESNVFTFSRDFDVADPSNKFSMPNIPEEYINDIYIADKKDCINYYLEVTGTDKENVRGDLKIIDIMKMFYNNFVAKHNNEVENLRNKLKSYEESRKELQFHVDNLKTEYSKISKEFSEKDKSFQAVADILTQIKDNMNIVREEIIQYTNNGNNTNAVMTFKENLLKLIDSGLGLSSANVFEQLIDSIVGKHENDLSEIMNRYIKLQEHMENVTSELKVVNENLLQMKSQLTDKENEYNLLKAQKEKVQEISNAVTLDIVSKERELSDTIRKCCQKLVENAVISTDDIDWSMPLGNNINVLFDRFLKQYKLKNCDSENLLQEINKSATLLQTKENELETLKAENEKLHEINNNINLLLVEKTNSLETQKTLYEDLNKIYERKAQENQVNISLVEKITEENYILKEDLNRKQETIESLTTEINTYKQKVTDEGKLVELMNIVAALEKEVSGLKTVNEMITREKEVAEAELLKAEDVIKLNKIELEENYILKEDLNRKQETIESLTTEINTYKQKVTDKGKLVELMNIVAALEKEVSGLKTVNEMITREKEVAEAELLKAEDVIKLNKIELEKMTSDILILRESVKENVSVIDSLKVEAKSLLEQNLQLKQQFEEKCRVCSRVETNIKIHEKTAEIQTKMITRLQKQKEEIEKDVKERDSKLEELTAKYTLLQKELEEIDELRNAKHSLESRVAELESELEALKRHTPNESILDSSRRRRQSLHDSQRAFADVKRDSGDHTKIEAVFESRVKPDDLFMDVDDDSSNRSTPLRLSRGRDSLLSRLDHNEKEEDTSRPSSVQATRRRRQSTHDLHRSVRHTPDQDKADHSEVTALRERLAACQEELEELKERYKELDDECETCAEYLRERDSQCERLIKQKAALEKVIAELRENVKNMNVNRSELEPKKTFADVSINTDEDWSNLHSVVVDRMSYDAEVEKNKRLTKIVEELRFKKQELNNTLAKMQKLLEKNSAKDHSRELQATKSELEACKQELEELRQRYKELDEECEICSQYLQERDEQCRKLREAKAALEAKLEQYQSEHSGTSQSTRKKRQSLHDQNRGSGSDMHEATTETSDDFLSYQVERDDSRQADQTQRDLKRLRLTVEKLSQQKAALEHQLMTISATHPMYVATGSAIVQNQQLTDVMKENQKLKKINAKLVSICKKRGKDNRENEDTEQRG